MAEEISNNVNQATTAVNQLDNAISNTTDSTKNLIGQAQKIASITNRQFNPLLATLDKLKRKISQNTREFDDFETILSRTEKGVSKLSTSFTLAAFANNKQAMMSVNTMHRYAEQMQKTAKQARNLAIDLDQQNAVLRQNFLAMAKNRELLEKTGVAEGKLAEITSKLLNINMGAEYNEITKSLTAKEKKTWDLIMANIQLAKSTGTVKVDIIKLTDKYQEAQEELVQLKNRSIDAAESQAMVNIEARKMQGGMTALSASVEGIVKGKFFSQLRDLMSGATIVAGFALIAKGFSDIGDQALKVNQIALSLGDTGEEAFGRFWKSGQEAVQMSRDLNDTAIRLGYSMDELSGIANRFMLGTKMDKEGRLGAASIAAMTQETARFAKVAGIDTSEAADLMDKRIRRFGMTAGEAVANMQEMRVTLMQMTAGMKGNMVDLGNMVKIIDEASEASQSYIVDTRLMTQALRGAVTQAQNLGMAQKQAQDIAKGLGKVLSTTPDFIKIPAGQALVSKLMGSPEEANKILMKLDKGTRKQVQALADGMKKGTIGQYSGTKAMMALIGQTEAGIEAQMDQLNIIIGDSSEAAAIVKETFQIENDATAQAITSMIQEAKKVQNAFKDEKISFSAAIAKDAVLFNEAIDKAGDDKEKALKEMQEKGASKEQAENYLNIYKLRTQKEKELRALEGKNDEDSKANRIRIEKELLGMTKDQLIAVDRMLDPTKELMSDIEKKTKQPLDIEMGLDKETLKNVGITTAKQLGDKLGMDYAKNSEFLEKAMTKGGEKSIQEMREARVHASKIAEETRRQMEDLSHFFADPIKGIEAGVKVFGNWIGLFTPWGKIVSGSLLAMAGVAMLWKGGSWIVEQGTFAALTKYHGPSGGVAGKGVGGGIGNTAKWTALALGVHALYNAIDSNIAEFDAQGNRIESAGAKYFRTFMQAGLTILDLLPILKMVGPGVLQFCKDLPIWASLYGQQIIQGGAKLIPVLTQWGTALLTSLPAMLAVAGVLVLLAVAAYAYYEAYKKNLGEIKEKSKKEMLVTKPMTSTDMDKAKTAAAQEGISLVDYLKKTSIKDAKEARIANPTAPSYWDSSSSVPPSISTSIPSTTTSMPEQPNQSKVSPFFSQSAITPNKPLETKGVFVGDNVQLIVPWSSLSAQHTRRKDALS